MSPRIYRSDFRSSHAKLPSYHEKHTIAPWNPELAPFPSLQLVKETTLKAGYSHCQQYLNAMWVILIPLVGEFVFSDDQKVGVGESLRAFIPENTEYNISNPHPVLPNHFLQIGIAAEDPLEKHKARFSLSQHQNRMQLIHWSWSSAVGHWRVMLGKFDGRTNYLYKPQEKVDIFAYAVEGAFELENCLLEKSDGLALTRQSILEFESLSNDAILMMIEFAP